MLMLLWLVTAAQGGMSLPAGENSPLGGKDVLQRGQMGCKTRATPSKKTCGKMLGLICRKNFGSLKRSLCLIHNLV